MHTCIPLKWRLTDLKLDNISVFPAYICHHNAFLVYDSMKKSNYKSWTKVVHISISFVVVILSLVGVTGYFTYKSFTQGKCQSNI